MPCNNKQVFSGRRVRCVSHHKLCHAMLAYHVLHICTVLLADTGAVTSKLLGITYQAGQHTTACQICFVKRNVEGTQTPWYHYGAGRQVERQCLLNMVEVLKCCQHLETVSCIQVQGCLVVVNNVEVHSSAQSALSILYDLVNELTSHAKVPVLLCHAKCQNVDDVLLV